MVLPVTHTLVDAVQQYALDVTTGAELAGPLVRLACARHLRDLDDGGRRGLHWDWDAAKYALNFFPSVLTVTVANEILPFELHASQVFIVGSLFGWKGDDGWRRFRVAYIEEGKGNGKSPLAAGIGLEMLTGDKEIRAEVYAAAVTKDQARVLYRDAVAMRHQSPLLRNKLSVSGGPGNEWNIAYFPTQSFFRLMSSEDQGKKGQSGPRPHCAILDELHEHPTNHMLEMMRAGTKGRRQALILAITNSGVVDPTAVCYEYHQYAERLLNGQDTNDAFFAYVCGLDEGDSWTDETVWKKSNPLLGVSVTLKYLREQVREAQGMPSKQNLIRRLNFCEWVDSAAPFIDMEVWRRNGEAFDIEALRGRSCVAAADLSKKNDLSCVVLLFDPDVDGKRPVLVFFWTPADTVRERADRDKAPYQQWIDEGFLLATPGKTIGYDFIAAKLVELAAAYEIAAVGFDPWNIDQLEKELQDIGAELNLVKHSQGFKDMSSSIQALEDLLLDERLQHALNPVLTWCVGNVSVENKPPDLRMFVKKTATRRIDGAITLAMAAGLSATFLAEPQGSYAVTEIGG